MRKIFRKTVGYTKLTKTVSYIARCVNIRSTLDQHLCHFLAIFDPRCDV